MIADISQCCLRTILYFHSLYSIGPIRNVMNLKRSFFFQPRPLLSLPNWASSHPNRSAPSQRLPKCLDSKRFEEEESWKGAKENFQAVQTAISKAGELQQWVALDNPEDTVPVLWSDPENKLSRTFMHSWLKRIEKEELVSDLGKDSQTWEFIANNMRVLKNK